VGSKISDAASATKEKTGDAADSVVKAGKKGLKYVGDAAKDAK